MRIISGIYKGSKIYLTKNKITRPLKDMVRESIFNLLIHSSKISFDINKSSVLDLYSGTGSFGLECLSRNARKVLFIENEKNSIKILKNNIEKLKLEKKTKILFDRVENSLKKKNLFNLKFDLIFCDPPFKLQNMNRLIHLIYNSNIMNKNCIFILHRDRSTDDKFPDNFKILDERLYGRSKITFSKFLP